MLLNPGANFELAAKLRAGAATLGEVYSFISGLYFRGKVAYSDAFGSAPQDLPPAVVIVQGLGLLPLQTLMTAEKLTAAGAVSIERDHIAYRTALLRDAKAVKSASGASCQFVLLGMTAQYDLISALSHHLVNALH